LVPPVAAHPHHMAPPRGWSFVPLTWEAQVTGAGRVPLPLAPHTEPAGAPARVGSASQMPLLVRVVVAAAGAPAARQLFGACPLSS
jgi:hypothetical protein